MISKLLEPLLILYLAFFHGVWWSVFVGIMISSTKRHLNQLVTKMFISILVFRGLLLDCVP